MSEDVKAASVLVLHRVRVPVGERDAYRAAHPTGQPSPRHAQPLSAVECSAASLADGPCPVGPQLTERYEPFRRAAYREAMHKVERPGL